MGINSDLKDKSRVVHAQSYKKGIPNEKGVVIPEQIRGAGAADKNKQLLHDQVKTMVNLILMDRDTVVQQVLKAQDQLIRDNARVVLEDPASQLAEALADAWAEVGVDLPNVELYKGMCGYERHSWFKAGMPTQLVAEPDYFYVVDPWSRGVSVISLSGQQSDIVVLQPWSPFHIVYAGKAVRSLALVEIADGVPNFELAAEIIYETSDE